MSRDPSPFDIATGDDDESEFGWGAGIFPPGVAGGEGQRFQQDDFGANLPRTTAGEPGTRNRDNYARMVADKRTDSTDPESSRDFESLGNTDRYGAQPPLVRADTKPNKSQRQEVSQAKMVRKW